MRWNAVDASVYRLNRIPRNGDLKISLNRWITHSQDSLEIKGLPLVGRLGLSSLIHSSVSTFLTPEQLVIDLLIENVPYRQVALFELHLFFWRGIRRPLLQSPSCTSLCRGTVCNSSQDIPTQYTCIQYDVRDIYVLCTLEYLYSRVLKDMEKDRQKCERWSN